MTAATIRWSGRVGETVYQVELSRGPDGRVEATVDGRCYVLSVTEPQARVYSILENGVSHEAIVRLTREGAHVRVGRAVFDVASEQADAATGGARRGEAGGRLTLNAVMPGRVLRVLVKEGQSVRARQGLVVLEAMKMENELAAPRDGAIRKVHVQPGQTVEAGDPLVAIDDPLTSA